MGKDGKVCKVIINFWDIMELFEFKEWFDSVEKIIECYESELVWFWREEG